MNKLIWLLIEMRSEAIPLGKEYIHAERNLDTMFKTGSMRNDSLLLLIEQIEDIRAKLRYVHLSKHLETVELLSEKQTKLYNKLRGYSEGGVCDNIPEGTMPKCSRNITVVNREY